MSDGGRGARVEVQISRLLLRGNRRYLYELVVDGVDGVDTSTYPVISGLARVGPTTTTALASAIGIDRSVVTRYVSRLEDAGHVRRNPHEGDGRATLVELTPAGRAAIKLMRRRLTQLYDDVLDTWTPDEVEQFTRGLERFTTALLDQRP